MFLGKHYSVADLPASKRRLRGRRTWELGRRRRTWQRRGRQKPQSQSHLYCWRGKKAERAGTPGTSVLYP